MVSLGQRPRTNGTPREPSAESAIHFWRRFVIIAPCLNRSVRSSFTSSLVPRIVSLGSIQTSGHAMHAYLATVCRDLGAELVRVGGVADHVHIVTTLPRTVSQAQLIEQIKKASSKWIKALDRSLSRFFLAAGIWRLFGESESARYRGAICRGATRAPSHSHLSGGISRVASQARR